MFEINILYDDWDDVIDKLTLLEVIIEHDFTLEERIELAGLALDYAKQIVPVLTGALRDSLEIRVSGDSVFIGSDLNYSTYVELGTSKMTAKPYLIPALLVAIAEWHQRFPEKIRKVIERI